MAERLVLITGATGAVGPAVVGTFLAAGWRVRTLSKDAPYGNPPASVEVRLGDICDPGSVRSAVAGSQAVIHLAALLHQFESFHGLDQQFERINVGGTENVVREVLAAGVGRIVFLSTIAVYGASHGRSIDEGWLPEPDTAYGRSKLDAERVVLSARIGGQPIGTVLRAAAVYGRRVKGNYHRLALAIARRRFVPLGRCLNRRTLVHDTDLGRAVVLAAEHPAAAGGVFNVTDGAVHTLRDIINAIYRAADRRPPRLHVPMAPLRAMTAMGEAAFGVVGLRLPVTRALLEKYTEDVAVDGTLARRVLGFRPEVGLEAGWEDVMRSIGKHN